MPKMKNTSMCQTAAMRYYPSLNLVEHCRLMNSVRVRACLSFSSYFVLYFFVLLLLLFRVLFYFILSSVVLLRKVVVILPSNAWYFQRFIWYDWSFTCHTTFTYSDYKLCKCTEQRTMRES